jgi:hypothetical protein
MSLDGSRQHHVGSSRYSSASPSFHNEPDDFRTRLNRLSLQSSSSASPLGRSSSLRSRPGGGVADVGLGRRSTILDGSVRSVRTGYDIDKRDTALPRRDSPYRPSTSYARHSEHYGLQDTMNGQHGSPSERRYLRASPATSRSHRSSAYSSSTDISPSRTPTPTASAALDGHYPAKFRKAHGHDDRRSGRYEADELLSSGDAYRSSGDKGDGSSAGRSVSNSTVRDFGGQDDDTLTYRLENNRRSRANADDRPIRVSSPADRDHLFDRSEPRVEASRTLAWSRSSVRHGVAQQPDPEDEMPAEEKVDMWMRSGSGRLGSGDDPSSKRRAALPAEFRNDMVRTHGSTSVRTFDPGY